MMVCKFNRFPDNRAVLAVRRIVLVVVAFSLVAGAKKQPKTTVRFFTESSVHDSAVFGNPVQLRNPDRVTYISKIPAISERDIAGVFPFPAADGTAGCAFQLDEHGTIMLDTLSVEKRGTTLLAMVNGRRVIDILIDKRVADGLVTIPRGLAALEIDQLVKAFPVIGGKKAPRKD
ncbi:MAG: hypothetical protein M3O82_04090 [Verrucomicrobiota bacterium]|nr:hypothetical protein [Verrucomicrobiota bacterium]